MFKNFHNIRNIFGGVTIVELIVVIFIFTVITSITIFNYGSFNTSLSIQNLADDIALTVRRAQGYAIGVRGYGDSFDEGYGIHFTATPGSLYAGSNKSFILFADVGTISNNIYDYNNYDTCGNLENNECIEVLSIRSADEINAIYLNDETEVRSSTGTLDILFKRPNPEPSFCYRMNGDTSSCDESSNISSIKIKISSSDNLGVYKIITISNNGQISVQ